MSGKKVEGYWDCTYCDTKGIGGLTKVCPNCGNPQAKNLKFYLKPGAKKYLAPEIADNYGKGADWVCAFCGSFNRYNATICENCGAGKADSEEDYFGKKVSVTPKEDYMSDYYGIDEKPQSPSYEKEDISGKKSSYDEKDDYIISDTKTEEKSLLENGDFFSNIKAIFGITAGIVGLIAIIMLIISIFTPKNYSAQISDKTWNRNVTVQELRTLKEDDWNVPSGGRVYDSRRKSEVMIM